MSQQTLGLGLALRAARVAAALGPLPPDPCLSCVLRPISRPPGAPGAPAARASGQPCGPGSHRRLLAVLSWHLVKIIA